MPTVARDDRWVQDATGRAIAGALVYWCTQPANVVAAPPSPLATIYTDSTGIAPAANPQTTNGLGHASAYMPPGIYTVVFVYNGVIQQVYPDQAVGLSNSTANSLDQIRYVSPFGNDSNDGLSWGTAKLTAAAAFSSVGGNQAIIFESPQLAIDGIAGTGSATGVNGYIWAPTRFYIGPSAQATSGTTGVDSGSLRLVGSVWNGSKAVDDFWEIHVNAFSGAFSNGSNLEINHSSVEGGSGRVLVGSDFVVGNPRSATPSLNSNSFAFDNQGAYYDSGSQSMLWEMGNTVNQDGGSLNTTIFRQNFVPVFSSSATGVQAELALGGSGVLGVSGNYSGAPKWLFTNLRPVSAFHTMSLEHSATASRTITFPDATGTLVLTANPTFTGAVLLPAGSGGAPGLAWSAETNTGMYRNASGDIRYSIAGNDVTRTDSTGFALAGGTGLQWGSPGAVTSRDTAIWRTGGAAFAFGNTTPGDASGTLNAALYQAGGTSGVSAGSFASITAITTKGGIVTQLTGTSDERLKSNIAPFSRGLEDVLKIHPALYNWNEAGQAKTGFGPEVRHAGFIAQDIQKAIPEAVCAEGEYLAMSDRPLIAALVNAVKELSARVQELEKAK